MSHQPGLKRIGYVDYRLDNFHATTYLAAIRGQLAGRGYEVVGATALIPAPSREWAAEKQVPYFDTVAELNEYVDNFMVLAPSDPQCHLRLCEEVLPYKKPTFVDKTFAPDLETAGKIFNLADRYGAAIQTTSALRYTAVQHFAEECADQLRHLYVWAGGDSFAEYGIHPVELAVSCLGASAEDLTVLGGLDSRQLILHYPDHRVGIIDFTSGSHVDFCAGLTTRRGTEFVKIDLSVLFIDAAAAVLDFFDLRKAQVPREETLLIHKILELAELKEPLGNRVSLVESSNTAAGRRRFVGSSSLTGSI